MAQLLMGRYRIERALGQGGFGRTFLARDLHLPTQPFCVVKQLDPKFCDRKTLKTARRLFELEAQTLYRLGQHDQIPKLLAHFEVAGEFYLVLEFVDGKTLQAIIDERRTLQESEVTAILHDLLQVLTFVHQQKVIHRDIKPANLIIRSHDSKVVLIDFGAVKQITTQILAQPDRMNLTVAIGSSGYMAAEQQAGRPRFSSDLYAVGMVCLQLLTGLHPERLPVNAETGEFSCQLLKDRLKISPGLAAVIDHLIRYDYRDRYPDAAVALGHLSQPLSAEGSHAVISSASETPSELTQSKISEENFNLIETNIEKDSISVGSGTSLQGLLTVQESRSQNRREYHNRLALLNKVKNYWIKGVLEHALPEQIPILLKLEAHPQAIRSPWHIEVVEAYPETQPSMMDQSIEQLFHSLGPGRSLLILGDPGSGKTTALLQLARDLIARAEQNPVHLMPVVLNLSSWSGAKQTIKDWMIEELNLKYQVPALVGKSWIEQQQMLLLLDGLDEVMIEYREACVAAINQFQQRHSTEMVVCSRAQDYQALNQRFQFQKAVYLQPLSPEQIQAYLAQLGPGLSNLQTLLAGDPILQELAQTPLILNIMVLAYRNLQGGEIPRTQTLLAQRQHLFNVYIKRMLAHRNSLTQVYPSDQTLYWLAWLAQQQLKRSQTIFLIERLQPDWLSSQDRVLYRLGTVGLVGLTFGCLYGFPSQLGLWLVHSGNPGDFGGHLQDAVNMVLIYGPVVGLASLLLPAQIIPIETLNWSWQKALKGILGWAAFGSLAGLLGGLLFDVIELSRAAQAIRSVDQSWMTWGLTHLWPFDGVLGGIAGFVFGLTSGLQGTEVESKIVPNQAIWRSARSALHFSLIGGAMGGFAGGILSALLNNGFSVGVINGLCVGLVIGLIGAGGQTCLKHFMLRLLLYVKGYIPWNYQRFLDYAADRIFLQKVGGGYLFIHRLLLEHFAALEG